MFIIDMNQVMIANLYMQIGKHENAKIDINMLRHMVLNSIKAYRNQFCKSHGELIIACDSTNYWRKDIFPYYKILRKKDQEKSEIDWTLVFKSFAEIIAELKVFFPYRVIQINKAEADDIIATLCFEFSEREPMLIISGDKDFRQLHINKNIKQFGPTEKKYIKVDDAELFLKEHIIRGDKGDSVPNFLSQDDSFATKTRQKNIMQTKVDVWLTQKPEEFCDEVTYPRYLRNKQLIDLRLIPENIKEQCLQQYNEQASKINDRSKLFNYFIKYRLRNLMESISDF